VTALFAVLITVANYCIEASFASCVISFYHTYFLHLPIYHQVVFAWILGLPFFGEKTDLVEGTGTALIMLGAILVSLRHVDLCQFLPAKLSSWLQSLRSRQEVAGSPDANLRGSLIL